MSIFYTNNPARNANARTTHNPTIPQGGVTYYGILKRWAGSWAKAKLNVYSGGAWVQKTLKRWDGTAWKEVDVTG